LKHATKTERKTGQSIAADFFQRKNSANEGVDEEGEGSVLVSLLQFPDCPRIRRIPSVERGSGPFKSIIGLGEKAEGKGATLQRSSVGADSDTLKERSLHAGNSALVTAVAYSKLETPGSWFLRWGRTGGTLRGLPFESTAAKVEVPQGDETTPYQG